ncbi:hypothetical protein LCGC14_2984330 [marine sediment metagenome]|uniref:Uncharacterized protein n=1 Tax=marine sediment metagenome TaxID=412755 RepID=A0A0F8X6M2_9ZZZZ
MLNKKQTRKFILDWLKQHRPHLNIERVSAETYETLEAHMRVFLKDHMQRYPTLGKTFKI